MRTVHLQQSYQGVGDVEVTAKEAEQTSLLQLAPESKHSISTGFHLHYKREEIRQVTTYQHKLQSGARTEERNSCLTFENLSSTHCEEERGK